MVSDACGAKKLGRECEAVRRGGTGCSSAGQEAERKAGDLEKR